jgi:outer membrane protein assembly factor BamB
LHHDVACQIYDWDGDGDNEVIVAAKDSVITLDGKTGEEIRRFPIPVHASDSIAFVNVSGASRATDILIKTRYSQIWAFNREGKQLWTAKRPPRTRTAHQPYPVDINDDGKDEIMAGYALLNADGSVRWSMKDKGLPMKGGHMDCARFLQGRSTRLLHGQLCVALR